MFTKTSFRGFKATLISVLFLAAPALAGELETPEQIRQYLVEHREDVSLASYTVRPDGTPDPADPVIYHNADQPMPLASTMKIVVLAAYAREVAAGRLDPNQTVTLADWEDYYLPGTDGGAHPAALEALGIPADEFGRADDPTLAVPLDLLAKLMIGFSDNAATDYLITRIGRDNLRQTIAQAGLTGQEVPLPILGTFLSWSNHEDGLITRPRVRELMAEGDAGYEARVDRLTAAFQDPDWRQAEFQFLLENSQSFRFGVESLAAHNLVPQGTAREYARIMAGVVTGTFLSPEISALMRRHLELELPNQDVFLAWGFKGGSLAGVLTSANYFVPAVGDFTGKPRIAVLFLSRLSQADFFRLFETSGEIFFDLRLALDRTFARRVRRTLP